MKVQQKCGTCRWLQPREDGKPFYHGHAYKCRWVTAPITWPDSVTLNNPVRGHLARKEGPGHYMSPRDGKACPCWGPT